MLAPAVMKMQQFLAANDHDEVVDDSVVDEPAMEAQDANDAGE